MPCELRGATFDHDGSKDDSEEWHGMDPFECTQAGVSNHRATEPEVSSNRIYHERLQNPGRETDWATCYSEFQLLGKLRWRGRLELGTGEA
nr:uncharacterized protein LOC105466312 isoform X1 [Macaca nemestrina]